MKNEYANCNRREDWHFLLVRCPNCTARHLSRMNLGQVEDGYRTGYVTQVDYEAYMYLWSTSAHRYSAAADGWRDMPADPEVLDMANRIRAAHAERRGDYQFNLAWRAA